MYFCAFQFICCCNQCSFCCVLHCPYPHLHRSTARCQVYITTCLLIRFQLLISIDNICRSLFILQIFQIIYDFSDTAEKEANGVKDSAELKAENVKSTNNREKDSSDEQNK